MKKVVICSDDWGSNRIPDYDTKIKYKKSIHNKLSVYDEYDVLEKKEDLLRLGELIDGYKNRPTFNTYVVLENPDFERILEYKCDGFYSMDLFDSYEYYYGQNNKNTWSDLTSNNLFFPQLHSGLHLNKELWLNDLNLYKDKDVYNALRLNTTIVRQGTSSRNHKHYLASFHNFSIKDLVDKKIRLEQDILKFKLLFNMDTKTFTPPNYVFPKSLFPVLKKNNIKSLQCGKYLLFPNKKNGKLKSNRLLIRSKFSNVKVHKRNVSFEPILYRNTNKCVDNTLQQISNVFQRNHPAIISTHRINYCSNHLKGKDPVGLSALKILINKINSIWPDVRYMTSDEL